MASRVIKRLARSVAPVWYERIRRGLAYRRRFSPEERRLHRAITARHRNVIAKLALQTDWCVQAGPFAGLRYPRSALRKQRMGHLLGSALAPKLLGSYEAELHGVITAVAAREYAQVVDIGTGEGYYAVGLARSMRSTLVYGFESSAEARRFCRRMAALNGVAGRVRVFGRATTALLNSFLDGRSCFVLCDCEGCEVDLLDPETCPGLVKADILVELHEHLRPGVTTMIEERFKDTHSVQLIHECSRDPSSYSALFGCDNAERELALREGRPAVMAWAWLRALDGAAD